MLRLLPDVGSLGGQTVAYRQSRVHMRMLHRAAGVPQARGRPSLQQILFPIPIRESEFLRHSRMLGFMRYLYITTQVRMRTLRYRRGGPGDTSCAEMDASSQWCACAPANSGICLSELHQYTHCCRQSMELLVSLHPLTFSWSTYRIKRSRISCSL
jgi:hypothetical protein